MAKKWITKDNTTKKVPEEELDKWLAEGWTAGRITFKSTNNPFSNKSHSEESKQKMSEAKEGFVPWNKGVPMQDTTKLLLSSIQLHKRPLAAPVKLDLVRREDISRLGYDGCTLTPEDVVEILSAAKCETCGREDVILMLGLRDWKLPHTRDNCFCQCSICYRNNKYKNHNV